jgi:hypothetical protein
MEEETGRSEAKLIRALLQLFESLAGRCSSQSELGRNRHACSVTYPCIARQA